MKLKFLTVLFFLSIISCKEKEDNKEISTEEKVKAEAQFSETPISNMARL